MLGRHHSDETKRKMSESAKKRPNNRLGVKLSEETKLKMSMWRKLRPNWSPIKGKHHSEETKIKIGLPQLAEKNHLWKGDKVGYAALHTFIKKRLPKPDKCPKCGGSKYIDLANLGVYNRDLKSWAYMCRKCHWRFDFVERRNN